MYANPDDQALMQKARKRVAHRIGLIIHALFWVIISAVVLFTVDWQTGLMLFGFFGLTVAGNAIAYLATSGKSRKGYAGAVQREYEKMKSEK